MDTSDWEDEAETAVNDDSLLAWAKEYLSEKYANAPKPFLEAYRDAYDKAKAEIFALPPEFLRKGRFDELFKVELPTEKELEKIIEIKLKAKGKELSGSEYSELAKIAKQKGCNGGDVEFAVNQAIENRYIAFAKQNDNESRLTFDDVKAVFEDKDTKSVSETLKEKIDALRAELAKYPFRNASRE